MDDRIKEWGAIFVGLVVLTPFICHSEWIADQSVLPCALSIYLVPLCGLGGLFFIAFGLKKKSLLLLLEGLLGLGMFTAILGAIYMLSRAFP